MFVWFIWHDRLHFGIDPDVVEVTARSNVCNRFFLFLVWVIFSWRGSCSSCRAVILTWPHIVWWETSKTWIRKYLLIIKFYTFVIKIKDLMIDSHNFSQMWESGEFNNFILFFHKCDIGHLCPSQRFIFSPLPRPLDSLFLDWDHSSSTLFFFCVFFSLPFSVPRLSARLPSAHL